MLARKHAPGSAEPNGDFIRDEEDIIFPAEMMQSVQVLGWMVQHAGGALHERLDDQRRNSRALRPNGALRFLQGMRQRVRGALMPVIAEHMRRGDSQASW